MKAIPYDADKFGGDNTFIVPNELHTVDYNEGDTFDTLIEKVCKRSQESKEELGIAGFWLVKNKHINLLDSLWPDEGTDSDSECYAINRTAKRIVNELAVSEITVAGHTKKCDAKPVLAKVTLQSMGANGGSIAGTVNDDGRRRKIDYSWGTHEVYFNNRVIDTENGKWYNAVAEVITDKVLKPFEGVSLGGEYPDVEADVQYNDGNVVINMLRYTTSYEEDEYGDPLPDLEWNYLVKPEETNEHNDKTAR